MSGKPMVPGPRFDDPVRSAPGFFGLAGNQPPWHRVVRRDTFRGPVDRTRCGKDLRLTTFATYVEPKVDDRCRACERSHETAERRLRWVT